MTTRFQAFRNILAQSSRFTMTVGLLGLLLLTGCHLAQNTGENNPQLQHAKKLIEQGNFEAAFVELNKALQDAPKDPNVHLNLGWLYLYTDDVPNATSELAKAESLGPDLAETYHLRGALFSYQAQHQNDNARKESLQLAAIENFRKALEANDKNDQTYFDLATSLSAINRNEDALEVLDKGFEHIPDKDLEMQVNYQIATCAAHSKLQMYEEAIKDCQQALEFTHNPASRERIESMIENMKLMNPGLLEKMNAQQQAEEQAVINESSSD